MIIAFSNKSATTASPVQSHPSSAPLHLSSPNYISLIRNSQVLSLKDLAVARNLVFLERASTIYLVKPQKKSTIFHTSRNLSYQPIIFPGKLMMRLLVSRNLGFLSFTAIIWKEKYQWIQVSYSICRDSSSISITSQDQCLQPIAQVL